MKRVMRYSLLAAACLAAGCQPGLKAAPEDLTATLLFQGAQCGRGEAEVAAVWLTPAAAQARFGDQAVAAPQQRLLLIEMGVRPTTGYRLQLLDNRLTLAAEKVQLQLQWVSPPPGAIVAQMLTSPCLLLGLPAQGYTAVDLLDADGKLRLSLPLP